MLRSDVLQFFQGRAERGRVRVPTTAMRVDGSRLNETLLVVELVVLFGLRCVGLGELLQRLGVVVFERAAVFEKGFVSFAELDTLLGVLGDIVELILRERQQRMRRVQTAAAGTNPKFNAPTSVHHSRSVMCG